MLSITTGKPPFALVILLAGMLQDHIGTALGAVASPEADMDNYYKRMYDFGLGKRAYTYSANKRPQYDFGLGKRSSSDLNSNNNKQRYLTLSDFNDNDENNLFDPDDDYFLDDETRDDFEKRMKPYEFGLGKKRAAPAPYNFGLGKKRAAPAPYSFGLGKKRAAPAPYNFGLGKKRAAPAPYNFGLGKRAAPAPYNFGLGKRAAPAPYNFGLGKRYPDASHGKLYSFGLGKRGYDGGISQRSQRYNFGIGKRDVTAAEAQDILDNLDNLNNIDNSLIHNVYTRSQKYNFGLGKRNSLISDKNGNTDNEIDDNDIDKLLYGQNSDELAKRSRYSFGLGKRDVNSGHNYANQNGEFAEYYQPLDDDLVQFVSDPHEIFTRASQKFNFGLGKREVSKEDLQQFEKDGNIPKTINTNEPMRNNNKNSNMSQISREGEDRQEETDEIDTINKTNNNKHQQLKTKQH